MQTKIAVGGKLYRVRPEGDKWMVHQQHQNGWSPVAWYYEESSAREHVFELQQEEEGV